MVRAPKEHAETALRSREGQHVPSRPAGPYTLPAVTRVTLPTTGAAGAPRARAPSVASLKVIPQTFEMAAAHGISRLNVGQRSFRNAVPAQGPLASGWHIGEQPGRWRPRSAPAAVSRRGDRKART